jgi:hypothetical protein
VPLRNIDVIASQVELVSYHTVMKNFKFTETIAPLCSGDTVVATWPECQNMAMVLKSPTPATGMQGAMHISITDQLPSSSGTTTFTTQLFPRDRQVPPSSSGGSTEVVNPEEIGGSPLNASLNMPPSEFPEEVWSLQLFGATISVTCVECHQWFFWRS